MTSGLVRLLCCFWVFGYGAYALHGVGTGGATVIAGLVALSLNHVWREQQREHAAREHREAVEADEALRLHVREQQGQPIRVVEGPPGVFRRAEP
jgi:hypothetical protein